MCISNYQCIDRDMSLEGVFEVPDSKALGVPMELWPEFDSALCDLRAEQPQPVSEVVNWNHHSSLPQGVPRQLFLQPTHLAPASQNEVAPMLRMGGNCAPAPSIHAPQFYQQWPQYSHPVQMGPPVANPVFLSRDAFFERENTSKEYPSIAATVHPSLPKHLQWHQPVHRTQPIQPSKNLNQCEPNDRLKQAYQTLVMQATTADQPRVPITISQTPNRVFRKVPKRKRYRTAFTTNQILALEEVYSTQTYINKNERQVLTEKLKISDRAIKVWFQNRRMKGKRENQPCFEYSDEYESTPEQLDSYLAPSSSADSTSSGSPSSDLDYIESQINVTDEQGYVRLDDKALGTLLNVINPLIPNNIEFECDSTQEIVPENTYKVIYEPISPAETISSAAEDIEPFEPPKDEEEMRKLFENHFC